MAGLFLLINLFYTLPLHFRLKGLGRLLALLRSLAYIYLNIVLERHLTKIISSVITGLFIKSTKEKYRQYQQGYTKPNNIVYQYINVFKALPITIYYSRYIGDYLRPLAPRYINTGRLYYKPFNQSSITAAAYNRIIFIS